MNEGQTHGIPIGPDTSLVFRKFCLSLIDVHLIASGAASDVYVDDYELAFVLLRTRNVH